MGVIYSREETRKINNDLIRYGNIVSDVKMKDENGNFNRIRIIYLSGKKYMSVMTNGEVVEIYKF